MPRRRRAIRVDDARFSREYGSGAGIDVTLTELCIVTLVTASEGSPMGSIHLLLAIATFAGAGSRMQVTGWVGMRRVEIMTTEAVAQRQAMSFHLQYEQTWHYP